MKINFVTTSLLASTIILMSIGITSVDAQRGTAPPIEIPFARPDLAIYADVPAQIPYNGLGLLKVTVENTLTPVGSVAPFGTYLGGSAVSGVDVQVAFTGLDVLAVLGDSGLQCVVSDPHLVVCESGAIPAGGRATIKVQVKAPGTCSQTCGPVYTDAIVDTSQTISERVETNNRALGVTDVINCIN